MLDRLIHIGVDPALPRHETKHIVLTNAFALGYFITYSVAALSPTSTTLDSFVRVSLAAGALGTPLTFFLNRRGWHTAATTWFLGWSTFLFFSIGIREPDAAQHTLFLTLNAAVSWFAFPSTKRALSVIATAVDFLAGIFLTWRLHVAPPTPPPTYNVSLVAFGNRGLFFILIVIVCVYAAREMARVERALVEEREKTKSLLEKEVSHQVAERSRDLGEALARVGEAPAAQLHIGERFHTRYKVLRSLGEGGMGAVYEVERLTDNRRLALKVVTGRVSGANAARFAREAEIGARIHHENLVSIVDVGISNGAPFLVMELVEGGSLEDKRQRFGDADWALPILRQIASGLAALHEAGVVHRDLKPANVLLSSACAKISDFGISRLGDPSSSVDPEAPTMAAATPKAGQLTGTGALLGTPLYMAPEAAKGGRNTTSAADVFSFGILAHEMLTQNAPFAMPAVLLALASKSIPPPPPVDAENVPASVRDLVHACLSYDPSRRPTARQLARALEAG